MGRLTVVTFSLALVATLGHAQQSTPQTGANQQAGEPSEKVNPPRPLNQVDAEFSPEARQKSINGRCMVAVTVDTEGRPQEIHVVRCTDPVFAQSSLDAVGKYRFQPATAQGGKPVAANISVEISFRQNGGPDPGLPIRCGFSSPPGISSSAPDADGVYPLTKLVDSPTMEHFSDDGYGNLAFHLVGSGACDVVLTIDAKGKPTNEQAPHCEKTVLELPAARSLLKSRYKPGSMNGKAVPVRVSVHLELGEFAASK
jgi:TonB family protein